MQPAGDLVRSTVAAELPAGVQLRQHDGQRRHSALILHDVDRNARAVVANSH